jgi:hypothetical protein
MLDRDPVVGSMKVKAVMAALVGALESLDVFAGLI